jgi:hypothetical protein
MPNKTYSETIHDWALHTTAHAIPSIAETHKKSSRIAWGVLLLAATVGCGVNLYLNISEFLAFGVETQVCTFWQFHKFLSANTF